MACIWPRKKPTAPRAAQPGRKDRSSPAMRTTSPHEYQTGRKLSCTPATGRTRTRRREKGPSPRVRAEDTNKSKRGWTDSGASRHRAGECSPLPPPCEQDNKGPECERDAAGRRWWHEGCASPCAERAWRAGLNLWNQADSSQEIKRPYTQYVPGFLQHDFCTCFGMSPSLSTRPSSLHPVGRSKDTKTVWMMDIQNQGGHIEY
jgi:hypothetical protein